MLYKNLPDRGFYRIFFTRLILDGIFDRVEIRHSTLDPGGEQARVDPLLCTSIPVVELEIRGQIEELIIDGSPAATKESARSTHSTPLALRCTIKES